MLDIRADIAEKIKEVIYTQLPNCEIRVFGSRSKGTAKPYSDIDIALFTAEAIDEKIMGKIETAFENSDIPIRVEVLDWHRVTDSFRRIITENYLVL